jgi:hypothetical protein
MDLPQGLVALAAQQDGLITRQQAIEHGLSDAAIRHCLTGSRIWQRLAWGVYATFTGRVEERHRIKAALLYAGDSAIVSGATACRSYGMRYVPKADVPLLLVPKKVKRAKIEIARIRRVKEMPAARTIRGFPVAAPERSVLDAVRYVPTLRTARAALAEAVQSRLTTVPRILREFEGMDRRGMRFAARALADVETGVRSAPECDLQDVLRPSEFFSMIQWNAPLPEVEDLIPDGQIREFRLALEAESIEFHAFGDMPELTERRRARYASLGWRVLPFSPRRIREEPQAVLAEFEAACRQKPSSAASVRSVATGR